MVYSKPILNMTKNIALWEVINKYNNIQILYVDMSILFNNTILQSFYNSNKLNTSKYKSVHTSDIIRIVTLYKYGGIYIDLDTLIIRNISNLTNFITFMYPDNTVLANGILGLEKNSSIALNIINNIDKNWNSDNWLQNGPILLNDAMREYCGTFVTRMNSANCNNFIVFQHSIFFPIPYYNLKYFFTENESTETMLIIKNTKHLLGIHISNSIVANNTVFIGSKQPYSLLAQQYCPLSYYSCDSVF
jgi:lactosylceramide 4-alpha-galactosyltransferase